LVRQNLANVKPNKQAIHWEAIDKHYRPKTQKAAKCHTYSVTPSYTRVSAHDVISNIAVSEGIINHSAPQ